MVSSMDKNVKCKGIEDQLVIKSEGLKGWDRRFYVVAQGLSDAERWLAAELR